MKFLIITTDYPDLLNSVYENNPQLAHAGFEEQMKVRLEIPRTDVFYQRNLCSMGHETNVIIANNPFMQTAWAREHGITPDTKSRMLYEKLIWLTNSMPFSRIRTYLQQLFRNYDHNRLFFEKVLADQIRYYNADIVINFALVSTRTQFLKGIRSEIPLLVGQHAATRLSPHEGFHCYDLVLSSFPPTVEWFNKKGIPCRPFRLGFEPSVLENLDQKTRPIDISFIGSFFKGIHDSRRELIETLCERFPHMKIWSPRLDASFDNSPIKKCHMGQAFGREMYRIFCQSKITINHHGDVLPWANNIRLYDATGCGALLITDWKKNLGDLFEPGKEVVSYHNVQECADSIEYYLSHEKERALVAQAGQERTLREHTYHQRMEELLKIIEI